ncbi:MAG: alpha-amylase family glycosyl hydrolase [Eubacteriaceae bacterium]|nr:alpha-amylase family glycosyl hydrolase [Eubacteriaceae bacterium]
MKHSEMTIYHIFTMGYCGAEATQVQCDGVKHRLKKIAFILSYLKEMQINTLLLGPVFSSVSHGYDTTDYRTVDPRLGTNDDLKELVDQCHQLGFNVVLDCVFNHTGREFFAFQDIQAYRDQSRYKDWYDGINFWENNGYNDGFQYHNWAGCDNLVKLNLHNPEVRQYLKETMLFWIETFDIDGVRMDAANVMDLSFIKELGDAARNRKPDFYMVGESVSGDYRQLIQNGGLDSVTNYEDYKGMYSSLNDKNYFEIAYSLNRLFGAGGLYSQFLTYNFVDNHDVNRVASTLKDERDLEPLYLMLYTMPGIPSVYYGSEQGAKGEKGKDTDAPLRPCYESMHFDSKTELYQKIARMGAIRRSVKALREGSYEQLFVASCQMGFLRTCGDQRVWVLFNCEAGDVQIRDDQFTGEFTDLYSGEDQTLFGAISIPAKSGLILMKKDQAPEIPKLGFDQAMVPGQRLNPEKDRKTGDRGEKTKKNVPLKMSDYMAKAITEARRALDEGEVPVGAVLVKDGKIIARNHNRKEGMQDPTAHAEMLVIREAANVLQRWRLDDCELYVTAEPCPMCMGAIIQSRIKKIVYGVSETRYGSVETTCELGKHPMLSNQTEFYSGICEPECREIIQEFFKK